MRGSLISSNLWHGRAAGGSDGRSRTSIAWDSIVDPFAHPTSIPVGVNCSLFPLYRMGRKCEVAPLSIIPSVGYLSAYRLHTMRDRLRRLSLSETDEILLLKVTEFVVEAVVVVVLERDCACV